MFLKRVVHIVLFFFFCQLVCGQTKAEVQFSVRLGDFQSIVVNPSQKAIGVEFNSATEVLQGKSSQQQNHITVTSTSQYEIKVSSHSQGIEEQASLPEGIIQLRPSLGTGEQTNPSLIFSPVSLSSQEQTLITSQEGDIQQSFNMNYFVEGSNDLLSKKEGIYTTTIAYSIVPN